MRILVGDGTDFVEISFIVFWGGSWNAKDQLHNQFATKQLATGKTSQYRRERNLIDSAHSMPWVEIFSWKYSDCLTWSQGDLSAVIDIVHVE